MKLALLGDTHLRMRPPARRRETDFAAVCLGKLKQALEFAEMNNCAAILQAGDFFDSADPSKELISDTIELLRDSEVPMFAIHGQHDMAYHSEQAVRKSALRILEAAGVLSILGTSPKVVGGVDVTDALDATERRLHGPVLLYGASWGQDPVAVDQSIPAFHVLVAHVMVGDKPLYPGHVLDGPGDYVRRWPGYDLMLLGDYHYAYTTGARGTKVVNCGAMLRLRAAERDLDLRPKVVIFDVETKEATDVFLDVTPIEDCFDLTKEAESPERAELEKFVEQLKREGKLGVDFLQNLREYFDTYNVERDIQELIGREFDAAREGNAV